MSEWLRYWYGQVHLYGQGERYPVCGSYAPHHETAHDDDTTRCKDCLRIEARKVALDVLKRARAERAKEAERWAAEVAIGVDPAFGKDQSVTCAVHVCTCAARLDRLERAMREWAERSAVTKHIAKQIAGALGDQQANK